MFIHLHILNKIEGIKLIVHEINQDKGSAIQSALPHITGDFVMLQDGDLGNSPSDYEKMLTLLEADRADVVFGSRWLEKISSLSYHTIGNRLITWLANRVAGASLTDMASCYKMMSTKIFRSLNITSKGFGLESETTAKVFRRKLRVIEIPISYERRSKSQGKKLRLKDGLVACYALLKYTMID